jgi:hypothetical protein
MRAPLGRHVCRWAPAHPSAPPCRASRAYPCPPMGRYDAHSDSPPSHHCQREALPGARRRACSVWRTSPVDPPTCRRCMWPIILPQGHRAHNQPECFIMLTLHFKLALTTGDAFMTVRTGLFHLHRPVVAGMEVWERPASPAPPGPSICASTCRYSNMQQNARGAPLLRLTHLAFRCSSDMAKV